MNITMTPVNNFYTLVRTLMLNTTAISPSTTEATGFDKKSPLAVGNWVDTTEGTYSSIINYYYRPSSADDYNDGRFGLNTWYANNTRTQGNTYIAIGSNNEETQLDDVALKNEIDVSKYTATLHMENASFINGKGVLPITITIRVGNESILLGEISIQKSFMVTSSHITKDFMLARGTISDNDGNPISLSNGETKTFQIDIEF